MNVSEKLDVKISSKEVIHRFVSYSGCRYLIMMIGRSGSGKTTWARDYDDSFPECVRLSSDRFIEQEASLTGKTYQEVYDSCIRKAIALFHKGKEFSIEHGESVIIDRMNLTVEGRKTLLVNFEGYVKVALVFNTQYEDKYGIKREIEPVCPEEGFDLVVYN